MRAAADRLIIAFDMPTLSAALAVGRKLRGLARYAKIGSILFTAAGPDAIARFKALGFSVFLDLKFHDIPSTVEKSCRAAAAHGVSLLTVHAKGRREMLEAAMRGVRGAKHRPKVLAVTVLTNVAVPPMTGGGGSEKLGGQQQMRGEVFGLVDEAVQAKCDGIVASAQEVQEIRDAFPDAKLEIVCPGIRPSWAFRDDQRRIATPAAAIAHGADLLVIGRPITEAPNPREAAQKVLAEMEAPI